MTVLEAAERERCPICNGKSEAPTLENEAELCYQCWADSGLCIPFEVNLTQGQEDNS